MRDLRRYREDELQGNGPQTCRHKDIMYMLAGEILRSANTVHRNNDLCIAYGTHSLETMIAGQEYNTRRLFIDNTISMNSILTNLVKGVKLMAFFVKVFVREHGVVVNGMN